MSDAMSAIEIEDVLSSIRRLVSEDLRPAVAPAAAPGARLILTPALRVVPPATADAWQDEDTWVEEPAVAQLSPQGWSLPEAEPEPADLDAPLTLPIQPASIRSSTAPPLATEPAPLPPHRFTLTQAARVPLAESSQAPAPWDPPVDVIEARSGSAAQPVLENPEDLADLAAAEAIAGIEAGVGAAVTQDVPEGAGKEFTEEFTEDFAEDVSEGFGKDFAKVFPDTHPEDFEDTLEVISESDPAFLEDEAAEDTVEPPEATYDEVLLRELVRDILREELSGALGEKITRNVRKLVRAEIAQALATRELD